MSNPIKKILFDFQLNRCHKRYEKNKQILSDPYGMWQKEREGNTKINKALADRWEIVTLSEGDYELPERKWSDLFQADSDVGLIYADEDMIAADTGMRYGPWFKPDYSPDTLLSFFYMGSLIFLRRDLAKEAWDAFEATVPQGEATKRQLVYDFILFYTEFLEKKNKKIAHISQVLFHGVGSEYQPEDAKKPEVVNEAAYWGYEAEYDACRLAAIARRGCNAFMKEVIHAGKCYHIPVYKTSDDGNTVPKVSVVIPSKDNVDVLTNCIESLYEKTKYPDFEVVVVDNGSDEENRMRVVTLSKKHGFCYIYEPMPFNFSKMCNLGVKASAGEYILLLNDDMEILQDDWMDVMVGQALVPGVGAVGAKLLYPDSDVIQHVGITNLWVGPAHKLLKEHDGSQDYYYGRNVLPYDMIGVTAACLLVSKEHYMQVGMFCEEIAVSYNDVDFCFSLHDAGYRNIIRNDVVLYHHESLSRGDDTMSDTKWDRLLHEKDFVYGRHENLKGKDPYYGPNLAGFKHKYFCSYLYPYEQRDCYCGVKAFDGEIRPEWHNNCLTITLEHARMERKLDLTDEEDVYWLEGWSYVLDMDNSRYLRTLLLIDESGACFEVDAYDRYRPDVAEILPEQVNVELAGFSCRIKKAKLKPGTYKVALLYRDMCSRQRLYKECENVFVAE